MIECMRSVHAPCPQQYQTNPLAPCASAASIPNRTSDSPTTLLALDRVGSQRIWPLSAREQPPVPSCRRMEERTLTHKHGTSQRTCMKKCRTNSIRRNEGLIQAGLFCLFCGCFLSSVLSAVSPALQFRVLCFFRVCLVLVGISVFILLERFHSVGGHFRIATFRVSRHR